MSLAKFFHFPLLKLYQKINFFKLSKGTPHRGLMAHTGSHQISSIIMSSHFNQAHLPTAHGSKLQSYVLPSISRAMYVPRSPKIYKMSLAKFFHFPVLKLYKKMNFFKLSKGTPHRGLMAHTGSHQISSIIMSSPFNQAHLPTAHALKLQSNVLPSIPEQCMFHDPRKSIKCL